jgi:hypothetical protein
MTDAAAVAENERAARHRSHLLGAGGGSAARCVSPSDAPRIVERGRWPVKKAS